VDIRLGAKYLLTLTSYYYEREWKFMAMITLQNSRNAEVTVFHRQLYAWGQWRICESIYLSSEASF